ncbi:hypothetical protein [Vibrio sp. B1FLJ16]|uniref:hypothetical protein n=1 Tax=Vibrio sp. B1FLJ16 TaxID=2751178 RepID=UPI0015F771BC|nr:hypothetical protein [Vibrio sp. B1FLJ16]CAD7818757.1 hypothetical protein ACOMICROBIO_EPCKBFOG_03455 [Vibrio sp. B1FLJ16]CAE6936044.1 hypothetical protein ACOMICROBIO_EPCKBFOG_03455 [Vibrio sp. B1FLJ16]
MNDVITRMWNYSQLPHVYKVCCVLILTALLMVIQFPRTELPQATPFNQLTCAELQQSRQSLANKTRLDILIPAHTMALPLLSRLCDERQLGQQYSDIAVHWLPRQQVTPQTIYRQKFDVMWGRDYQLAGLSPDYGNYYDKILNLGGYDVLWFAHQEIDDEFLKSHRIGLLNDTFSRSGYQLPLQSLKRLSLDLSSSKIILYQTRKQMQEAFMRGEVDVIAGTNHSSLNQIDNNVYKDVIASDVSAGGWYLSRSSELGSNQTTRIQLTQALGMIL